MKAKSSKKIKSAGVLPKIFTGIGVFVLAISLMLAGGRAVLSATDSSLEDNLQEKAIIFALENPDSELSMVLAQLVLVDKQSVLENLKAEREEMAGVLRDEENQGRFERVCYKFADSNFRFNCEGWGRFQIPTAASATTTASEVNRLGRDAVVDYAEVELTGTVSSTFNVYVGTATSTFVDYGASAGGVHPRPDNLIDGFEFVTSTAPVDSPDRLDTYRNLINSVNDAGTLGINAAPLASSSAVVFFMQSDHGASCGSTTGAAACEQVTSTARGFSGYVRYHYRYEVDL